MGMKVNRILPEPSELKAEYPLSSDLAALKARRDAEIRDVFTGKSDKFIVIIGPCSADNEDSVCEYVSRLGALAPLVSDKLILIPRIYTNKPRTTGVGYKGMLLPPDPEAAPDLLEGIRAIRHMHIRAMEESGLTAADEMLYPENRTYLDDVLSYEAVGARSVENQQHRLTASGMDTPVGMKNPTSGDLSVMLNSVVAAQSPQQFIYRTQDVSTDGNPLAHAILAAVWTNTEPPSPTIITKTACVYGRCIKSRAWPILPLSSMQTIRIPENSSKSRFASWARLPIHANTAPICASSSKA